MRWPSIVGWSLALATSGAALVGLTYLAGRDTTPGGSGLLDTLMDAVARPAVGLPLACVALLAGASCVRFLSLHWLAWRPGRIEVATFATGSAPCEATAEQLTTEFRRRLVTLHLQAPTPVPGAAPQNDFLTVLSANGASMNDPLAILVNLVRAAKPTHAYEIRGTLLQRPERPRYGITVQVRRLPSGATPPATVWGESWDEVIGKAADEATAAILPQTRRCAAPWGVWRGHVMPPGLMHAFEEGARLEHARRYDEALEKYVRAVHIDPLNLALRLRMGQLQERLGQYLDALATYWGICESADPKGARLSPLAHRVRGRRERRRALISARYRRNVLLGGRLLAEQWCSVPADPDHPTARDRQRMSECLAPWLKETLGPIAAERVDDVLGDEDPERRIPRLRELFAECALIDSRRLLWKLRFSHGIRATLTPASVKLTELCIATRLDYVRHSLAETFKLGEQTDRWPPTPDDLTWKIAWIERGRRFKRWHEQYNAACAYALPLLDPAVTDPNVRETLATEAVRRLQQATASADSAFIASRREWLLSEDPDLKALRATRQFEEFELVYLPSARITPCRPEGVQRLETLRYVRELLQTTAGRWERAWRARADQGGDPETADVIAWLRDERRAWEAVRDVALDHRHSATRCALIRLMRECADRYGFGRLDVSFPRYDQNPLAESARKTCNDACKDAVDDADGRMARIAILLGDPGQAERPLLEDLKRWEGRLARIDATRPLSAHQIARLCRDRAGLWQRFARWVVADEDDDAEAETEFLALLQSAASACAQDARHPLRLQRAA